jgi:hypothetical protein
MFARVVAAPAFEDRAKLLRALQTACGDPRAPAWALIASAAWVATHAHCEPVKRLAGQVHAMDDELYARVFVAEPDIAQCLDHSTPERQHRFECTEVRTEMMQRAQALDDLDERARALASLPDCNAAPPSAR